MAKCRHTNTYLKQKQQHSKPMKQRYRNAPPDGRAERQENDFMEPKIVEGVFQGVVLGGMRSRKNDFKRALLRLLIRIGKYAKPICPRINTYCAYLAWRILPISGAVWGDTFANDLLKLLLNNTAIAGIADPAASGNITTFYWSLHTADPQTGNQTTNEVAYTGYTGATARVSAARSSAGFTIVTEVANPTANVDFLP